MTTFYTATNGNNGNNGTSTGTPFLTIAKGISVLTAGDTLHIRTGTYNESMGTPTPAVLGGTSWNNPVTIAAYPSETVTLRPTSGNALLNVVGNGWKYIIFDRLIFDAINTSTTNINLDGYNQAGAGFIRFTNCEIKNNGGAGALLGRLSNSNEFIACHIHHNGIRNVGTRPDDHGLYIGTSNNLVEGCDIHDNTGYGVHIYNGYPGQHANNNVVRKNRVYHNGTLNVYSAGILLGSGNGNMAYNNIVYGQPNGINVGFFNSTNSKVYNNTIYNNSTNGILIFASSSTAIIRNNIAYSNGTNINNYNTTGGTTQSNNLTTSNPLFVNAGTGDFHLQAGSPAIDAGVVLSEVPRDFDDGVRPAGTVYDIGAYEYGSSIGPPPPDPPAAPSGLSVTVLSDAQLRPAWTDNATNESGYEIERSLTGTGGWVLKTTTGANATSYVDPNLTAATTYYYRVRAINVAGSSAYTSVVSATTAAAPLVAPAAPSALVAVAASSTRVDLAWTRNATNETAVKIERAEIAPGTVPFAQIATVGATIVNYSDTGRTPSTTYSYRVRNSNSVGDSAYSNTATVTTDAAPGSVPNAPTNLTVTVISYRQLDLMWVLNGGNPDGAYIERSEDGLTYNQIALVVGSSVVYFSDLSCHESTTYFYRVRLYNAAGPSAYSNITNATTPAFNGLVFTEEQLRSLAGLAPFPADTISTVDYWRHLAGLYRGPFVALPVLTHAPNPNVGIITLCDLYATGGPYHYSSFEPIDGANAYHGRILANASITKEQPDVFDGIPGKREAQLTLSNLNVNPEAPTLSEIEAVEDPIGLYMPVWLYDLVDQLDLFRLDGKLTSYQTGIATTAVTIAIDEPQVLQTPVPKIRTATVFPDLDLSTFHTQDPVVLVVFGPWRKAPVGLCRTDNLTYWDYGAWRKATAGQVTAVNVYRDDALVSPTEYTIVEPVTGYECIRFTLDQFDRGRPLPIVIDFTTTEFSQNPAPAIRFLLNDATFGLGQGVNIDVFNTAAINFNSIPIRMGGGLSEQQEARVYLRDMLFHGSFLERLQGGAYALYVDTLDLHPQHQDADFQLGFGLEDWHNIPNDPSESVRDESQRLAELAMEGGWDPYFNGNGSYHIHTKRTRAEVGTTKKLQNRFLFDGQSIDRQNHYLWYRTNARDKQFPIDAIAESYVLDVGHLVKTTIPTMQLDHTVMEVIRRSFVGGTSIAFSYLLAPWDVAAYNYVPGVIEQDRYADTLLDYRRTPPTQPTNFLVNGSTRPGESYLIESIAVLSVERVFYNITHVKFVAYRHTEPPSAVPLQEIEVRAPSADIGTDPTVTGEISVQAGLAYDFEAFAINKNNDPDRQESSRVQFINFIAPGDTIPPRPPTHLNATRGSLRTVFLKWEASLDAVKVREYEVERDTNSSFTAPVVVANVKTTNYTDTNTPYNTTFYYRVKAISRAGLSSLWSNVAVMTVVPAQPSDYGKESQYRFHRAPLNQIISGVVVSAHSAFAFGTGIDATKYEWQAGALGTPQATSEWDSFSHSGGLPLGTRLFEFVASGGFQGPFNTDFWAGFWNGTADTLNTVVRYMGS